MSAFLNSWYFNAVKAALLAGAAAVLAAQSQGQVHLPDWLAPIMAAVYGLLQSGQKKA
jgi:hypothetical protein